MNCNQSKIIDIQGHRGCRGLMPENTMSAFEKAIALGVHTLELDVAVSKDHIVVVSHEPFMNRVICLDAEGKEIPESDDKKYNLYQMTFDSIKQFDCGTKFHPRFPEQEKLKAYKPSLEEVIKTSKILNPHIKFNIEIKASPEYDNVYTPNPKHFVHLVLEVIKNNNAFTDTNLQSFDLRIMEEIKRQAPNMEVALLVDEDEDIWKKIADMSYSPEIISPYYKLLNKKAVKNLKAENFKVIPWTINNVEELQKIIDLEVDGIITDYPNRLIEILEN
ncbi:glycerophosphodiester phosphodiesterase family protein [Flavivirga amylovorans]|uniref:Glycerophosphodiester phosphodiesterase family protein n=1 Tax=Flavivirga amylovorans TaxID=870486 RepID=A0ABT8X4W8_9FLAO|nr:glycerophosphodiester phosphodiesterase family protein [Flavivirga amylovorans]MDO5988949.1 glycerophosphodiester phosphodiesterase family protein [Flavivirga amylovorans]